MMRRFPYPYRAALAICSDIDGTSSIDAFLEIQRFLNTKNATSMGQGVGLEIGNCLFFYDKGDTLAYFGSDDSAKGLTIDLIHSGYIDCLHTYGDGAVQRKQIVRALDELVKANCRLDVWTNHFGSKCNLSRKFEYRFGECAGADRISEVYHADLTFDYGIRFAWVGAGARVVGQSTAKASACLNTVFDREHPIRTAIDTIRETGKWIAGGRGDQRYVINHVNELTRPLELEDGRRVHEFVRYCNHPRGISYGATSKGLAYTISKRALEHLKTVEGFMIVYTHLGKNSDCSEAIDADTQLALRNLEREYRNQDIYVTTTSKLLNYYLAWKHLVWSEKEENGVISILIDRIDDPVFGPIEPTLRQLQGLTFYVSSSNRTRVSIRGKELTEVQRNPADESGVESVTLPLTSLSSPL